MHAKNAEHDGFFEIAKDEVDDSCAQQQREHRLVQDLEDNSDIGPVVGLGEGIGPLRFKTASRFVFAKASGKRILRTAVHTHSRATRTEQRAWRTTRAALVPSR